MIKPIVISALLATSMSTSAIELELTDSNNGIYAKTTEGSKPVSGAIVNVSNVPQLNDKLFTTDERGRVFIPLSLNASRSVRVETSDMNVDTIFHGHRR